MAVLLCYINFVLKSILIGINIATPPFCLFICFHFHKISFLIPLLSVCMGPWIWSESHVDNIRKGLVIRSTFIFVFIGTFNPFAFEEIVDRYVFLFYYSYFDPFFLVLLKEDSNISCNTGLVVMNSFSFFLFGKLYVLWF